MISRPSCQSTGEILTFSVVVQSTAGASVEEIREDLELTLKVGLLQSKLLGTASPLPTVNLHIPDYQRK
jgi:hypothetical protein